METIGNWWADHDATREAAGSTWYSEPEVRLRGALRRRGWEFKQQVRIHNYVLDFLIYPERLCVEVDGREYHERSLTDANRSLTLWEMYGILTFRVKARDCMRDPDAIVNRIALRRSEISAAQNGEFV